MKYTLPILAILASSALSHGQVTFNANGTIDDAGTQIGTYSSTGANIFDTPTGAMFQGQLGGATVSFSILTLDSNYEIAGPLTIGSTNLVSGNINANSNATTAASPDRAGFAIGAQGTSPIFTFSVPGVFDLGTYATPLDDFSNTIGATVDGMVFASGGSVAADTDVVLDFVNGEYTADTFLFTPDSVLGIGDSISVSVGGIGGNGSPGGESFAINVPIIETVPEPSSTALLGLSALALLARRKRA